MFSPLDRPFKRFFFLVFITAIISYVGYSIIWMHLKEKEFLKIEPGLIWTDKKPVQYFAERQLTFIDQSCTSELFKKDIDSIKNELRELSEKESIYKNLVKQLENHPKNFNFNQLSSVEKTIALIQKKKRELEWKLKNLTLFLNDIPERYFKLPHQGIKNAEGEFMSLEKGFANVRPFSRLLVYININAVNLKTLEKCFKQKNFYYVRLKKEDRIYSQYGEFLEIEKNIILFYSLLLVMLLSACFSFLFKGCLTLYQSTIGKVVNWIKKGTFE